MRNADDHRSERPVWGLAVALALGAAFVAFNVGRLAVNFQVDGQIPEYQAWAISPGSIGDSLNADLNPRLYSYYYKGLGLLARLGDRLQMLEVVYSLEILSMCAAVYFLAFTLTRSAWAGWIAATVVVWCDGMAVCPGGCAGLGFITGAEYPATAVVLAALALSWRRQHMSAAMLAGLAFNLHGSLALFGSAMVLAAAMLGGRRSTLRGVVWPVIVCLAAASPTLESVSATRTLTFSTPGGARKPSGVDPLHLTALPLEGVDGSQAA